MISKIMEEKMKEYYLIGEAAKIFDISADTLRYYDRIGLLKPVKLKNKLYRYYTSKQFDLLYMIQSLRLLDISLDDIKDILYNKDLSKFVNCLEEQEKHIENEINNLKMMKECIKTLRSRIDNLDRDMNEISIKKCPKMWAVTVPIDSAEDVFSYKDMIEINMEVDSQWATLSDFIFFINKKDLLEHNFIYSKYGMISKYIYESKNCNIEYIPSRQYAFSIYKGYYKDISSTYSKMIEWIETNGYLIDGDAIEKSIISLHDKEDESEYIIEIWIPVKNNS